MDSYEAIARVFIGFTLADIKTMSVRERINWVNRANRGLEALNG